MSKKSRTVYSTEFKVKLALEAVGNNVSINDIAIKYEVPQILVQNWVKKFIRVLAMLYNGKSSVIIKTEKIFRSKRHKNDAPNSKDLK